MPQDHSSQRPDGPMGQPNAGWQEQRPYGQEPGPGQGTQWDSRQGQWQGQQAGSGWDGRQRGEGPWADQTPRQRRLAFMEAVELCLRKYAVFQGRASRSELWWFLLACWAAYFLVGTALILLMKGYAVNVVPPVLSLLILLLTLPVSARRLHDTGRTAWWLLLHLTSIGSLVLLFFWCQESTPVTNRYGPVPNLEGDVPELERIRARRRARQQGAPSDGSFSEGMSDAVGDLFDKVRGNGQGQAQYGPQGQYGQQGCDRQAGNGQPGQEYGRQEPQAEWHSGYRQGAQAGWESGYRKGKQEGWESGYQRGQQAGREQARQHAHDGGAIPMPGGDGIPPARRDG